MWVPPFAAVALPMPEPAVALWLPVESGYSGDVACDERKSGRIVGPMCHCVANRTVPVRHDEDTDQSCGENCFHEINGR
jgi:hypothetical protein